MNMKRIGTIAATIAAGALLLVGCRDADVASRNLSNDADNFKVERRVVFFNGITDEYLLEIQGKCALYADSGDQQLEVTCKVGDDEYKKHYLGLSDNVSYFAEHMEPTEADVYHYKVNFKPELIIPDIDLRTSIGDN